jgi:hypothetical protein
VDDELGVVEVDVELGLVVLMLLSGDVVEVVVEVLELGEVVVLFGGAVTVALVELVVDVLVSGPVDPGLPLLLCATATPATTTRQAAAAVVRRVTRVLFIPNDSMVR